MRVLRGNSVKLFANFGGQNACLSSSSDGSSENKPKPKDFKEIPGPLSLPLIGTLYQYLPLIGRYNLQQMHKNGVKNYNLYGPIVREEIVPGMALIWLFNPEDVERVFKKEGQFPHRKSHSALEKYRLDRPNVYNSGGLLPTNGKEWERVRAAFQKGISSPTDAHSFIEGSDQITKEWISVRVEELLQNQVENVDFLPELSRLFLEIIGFAAFDTRFDSFYPHQLHPNSRSMRLIDAAFITNSIILKAENGLKLWKKFETPLYRKLRKAQDYMENTAIDLVALKMTIYKERDKNKPQTLLEKYLSNPAVDFKDIIGIACDYLLAGVDTTTYSSSFLLYHLATNPEKQQQLYEESLKLLPSLQDPVTVDTYKNAEYARCCIKESLRLRPIAIGVGRLLTSDLVLSGYKVPKDTIVVSGNQVMCRLDKYFPEPDKFVPERWIKGHPSYKQVNPFVSMSFGYGRRTCIAMRFATQNMVILLLNIIRRYEVKWAGGELDSKSLLINKPDRPIMLKLEKRE